MEPGEPSKLSLQTLRLALKYRKDEKNFHFWINVAQRQKTAATGTSPDPRNLLVLTKIYYGAFEWPKTQKYHTDHPLWSQKKIINWNSDPHRGIKSTLKVVYGINKATFVITLSEVYRG